MKNNTENSSHEVEYLISSVHIHQYWEKLEGRPERLNMHFAHDHFTNKFTKDIRRLVLA